MDVEEILDEYAEQTGWSLKQQLDKCLLYIGRQRDNDAFEEFLSSEADSRGDDEDAEHDQ